MCCGSVNLARYIYSSDSQREEWFEAGASAKYTRFFAPLPGKPLQVLRQQGQRVSFPGRICRQKKSPASCALEMRQRWCLQFVFDLNLSPRSTSHLGDSSHCPASLASSGFCLSAKLVLLCEGLSRWGTARAPLQRQMYVYNLLCGAEQRRSFHTASLWSATRTLEYLLACLKQAGVSACVGGQAFLELCKSQRLGLPEMGRTRGTRN